jgi:hypothetical protein
MLCVGDRNEQEAPIASQEPSNYQVGWRKLQRASVKFIQSQVHSDTKDQVNLDHSARIHPAAGNGSLVLPVALHTDTSSNRNSSNLFQHVTSKVYFQTSDEQLENFQRFVQGGSCGIEVG